LEQPESPFDIPLDIVSSRSNREFRVRTEAVEGAGRVVEGGEPGPARAMPVLVPPADFQEAQAIFDPPMLAYESQQVRRCDSLGIKTGEDVAKGFEWKQIIASRYLERATSG
jgi:hypothetical protein